MSFWVLIAICLFILAQIVRVLRLYICLGDWRMPLRYLLTAHMLGIAVGYLMGILFYEIIVLSMFAIYRKSSLVPVFYSFVILRILDTAAILAFTLIGGDSITLPPVFFSLGILCLLFWLAVYTFDPCVIRIKRKIVQIPFPFRKDKYFLRILTKMQHRIDCLAWKRHGTLAVTIVLTALSWGLEWSALYLCLNSGSHAALSIVDRVGSSLGLTSLLSVSSPYNILMYGIYSVLPLLIVYAGFSLFKRKRHA